MLISCTAPDQTNRGRQRQKDVAVKREQNKNQRERSDLVWTRDRHSLDPCKPRDDVISQGWTAILRVAERAKAA
jgi:hypothetical protein